MLKRILHTDNAKTTLLTKAPLLSEGGLWKALHESRTDWAMFLGSIFLIIKGSGRWSMDRSMMKKIFEPHRVT